MELSESFLKQEIMRTKPDYVIYAPACSENYDDHGNEHLHVFRAKDGNLCALWTMSAFEGTFTQRPVFSKSFNGGLTWSEPKCLLKDPIDKATGKNMGSWASAAVSKSGRIYVIYNKHPGTTQSHQRGAMAILYSDDSGENWSDEFLTNVPKSIYDSVDPNEPQDWVIWQMANRLADGTVLFGYTRCWNCPDAPNSPHGIYSEHPCSCEFFRLDNIDEDPEPKDLKLTFLAQNEQGLAAPLRCFGPEARRSSGEEPAVVELPDGRLFCVMRNGEGHVWYSVSEDKGETWRPTEMLRYCDGGKGVEHPFSPCPLFRIANGEYVLFTHNHDGFFGMEFQHEDTNWRNPVFMLRGEFRPGAHQPIWFSEPVELMNNGDVSITRMDMAMYGDLTIEDGEPVFWYPDRKFFLLGKRIPRTLLDTMKVISE